MENMVYRKDGVTLKPRYGGNSTHFLTSREWDNESGTYQYRPRQYNPYTGRFNRRDDIEYEGGINLYSYVGNNAVNKTDPLGNGRIPGFGKVTVDESCCRHHCCDRFKVLPETGTESITPECKTYTTDGIFFSPRYSEPRILKIPDNCNATITCNKYKGRVTHTAGGNERFYYVIRWCKWKITDTIWTATRSALRIIVVLPQA